MTRVVSLYHSLIVCFLIFRGTKMCRTQIRAFSFFVQYFLIKFALLGREKTSKKPVFYKIGHKSAENLRLTTFSKFHSYLRNQTFNLAPVPFL
jgi:hypothetical protein